jgi:hypothetical protein
MIYSFSWGKPTTFQFRKYPPKHIGKFYSVADRDLKSVTGLAVLSITDSSQ